MQILYCDDCGTRVDETEAVTIVGKNYCPQCAINHAPVQRSGVIAAVGTNPRSTRAQRPIRTTPGRPTQTGTHSAVNIPDTARQPGTSQSLGNAGLQMTFTAQAYRWANANRPLAIGIGCAVVGIIVAILWSLTGPSNGGAKRATSVQPNVVAATVVAVTPTPEPKTTTAESSVPAATVKVEEDGPRESKARRDLKAIKDLIAGGKSSPFEIRRQLKALLDPFWIRKTAMGLEAAKLLENYKEEKRPADKSDGAVPGVNAAISNPKEKAEDAFNSDFKPTETKTVPNINFPNVSALKNAFGRDASLAVKFTGFIDVPQDGDYTFYINSDDGSMFYIGDILLIQNAGAHAMTERDGHMELKAGKHRFRLEYYNGTGTAGMIFSWTGPGIAAKQPVPATALSSIPKK